MPDMLTAPVGPVAPSERPAIRIKAVPERDRRRLLMHFLALGDSDRLLRFGSILPDELITRYVQHLDFNRDVVFGVYDDKLHLVGVGHLAFTLKESLPRNQQGERAAEFGVSVSETARGQGIGSKLFERAAMHCRNAEIDTLYMHCLSSNRVMMHIAKKAGMEIQRDHGEADAYLKLPPASPGTVLREAVEEQVASLDYTMKAQARAAKKLLGTLPGFKN
ncbi:MAG: GNAT family N-acetyltransferase [Burkholderiaceae bacterium]|nr:GNAT family N-acetyltransferase [Burkholderiaceae bacterium]